MLMMDHYVENKRTVNNSNVELLSVRLHSAWFLYSPDGTNGYGSRSGELEGIGSVL